MSDLIDRQAAITAICEDGTWLEKQGCTEITLCERTQRDADILSELPAIDAIPISVIETNLTEMKKVKLSSIYGSMLKDSFVDDVIKNMLEDYENGE